MLATTAAQSQQPDALNPHEQTTKSNPGGYRDVARTSSHALVEIDGSSPTGPVNRQLFGICMVRPPFTEQMGDLLATWLEGGTMRVWPGPPPSKEPTSMNDYWQQCMMIAQKSKPAIIMGWAPSVGGFKGEFYYRSEEDTNFPENKRPKAVEEYVRGIIASPHPGFPTGYPVTHWEIWNEPEYNPHPGGFTPEEYARYVVDCSHRIKSIKPGLKIGAFVPHRRGGENDNWADRFLKELVTLDPQAVDFFENHGYNGSFWNVTKEYGSYLPRVAFAEYLNDLVNERVAKRLAKYGSWPLWNTEWNIHPPIPKDWKNMDEDAKHSTIDLAAAIYAASVLTVWQNEQSLAAAAFFDLNGFSECFSLFQQPQKQDQLQIHPTFYAIQLLGSALHGTRYATNVFSDSFRLPIPAPWNVPWDRQYPYVLATAAAYQGELRIVVVNREPNYPLKLDLKISPASATEKEKTVLVKSLTGESPEALKPVLMENVVPLERSTLTDGAWRIELPPHSVNVIVWKGWGS